MTELVRTYKIYQGTRGEERVEIGPDGDGLGLIEISYYDDEDKFRDSILINEETATILVDVLLEILGYKSKENNAL